MIENGLVYIHYAETPTAFAGCGALVEGPFIVTCRHVWEQALAAPGNDGTVHICFPPLHGEGNPEFRLAKQVDDCNGLGNPPDLVILSAEIPPGRAPLVLARDKAAQFGRGYVIAGLRRNGPDTPVRDVEIRGEIAERIDGSGLRQFTGDGRNGYWTDRGSSGSPLCIEASDELAGIMSLSETGTESGAAAIHEAFAVPSTTIHRHLRYYVGREAARARNVDQTKIPQILEAMNASEIAIAEVRRRLELYFETLQTQAPQPPPADDNPTINAAIAESRRLSAAFQPTDAIAVLDAILAEEPAAHRQRLTPLLEEKAQQQRLIFDYEGTKKTLRELLALKPDRTRRWIDLGDISVTTGARDDALAAFGQALAAAERITKTDPDNDEALGDLFDSHARIAVVQAEQGDVASARKSLQAALNDNYHRQVTDDNRLGDDCIAMGDFKAALKYFQEGLAITERLAKTDPGNERFRRNLAFSLYRVALIEVHQGLRPEALIRFRSARDIITQLLQRSPENVRILDLLDVQISALEPPPSQLDQLTIQKDLSASTGKPLHPLPIGKAARIIAAYVEASEEQSPSQLDQWTIGP